MATLYELGEKYNSIRGLLEVEGATEESLKEQLASIQEAFNTKAENIGKLILSMNGETVTIQTEIERLSARKQANERKSEWLKNYLLTEMLASGTEKIKSAIVSLAVRTNPPSVNIVDLTLVPKDYLREIPARYEPDKKAILDHVKDTGEVLPGCEIIKDRKSLSVK